MYAFSGEELVATSLFAVALVHTFSVKRFQHLAHKFPEGSVLENLFHLLGEVEAVFVIWATALIGSMAVLHGWHHAVEHIEKLHFTEPMFVFVIMTIAATKPIIDLVESVIRQVAKVVPLPQSMRFLFAALVVGPLLGSFITEPAAMTVTSLILLRTYFGKEISKVFKYALLGALFVHVSIGGTLTNFAAPPVIMVVLKWGWDIEHMIRHFGWKAAVSCVVYSLCLVFAFAKELKKLEEEAAGKSSVDDEEAMPAPLWVSLVHVAALAFTVINLHHEKIFMGGFILFLGFCAVTQEYQHRLKLKESLLVGGFLAGLVILGSLQSWWLQPVIAGLGELPLYFGTTALTAITDNAALTYLGAQVEGLSDNMKYMLVAGAVTGGGLTVIANAPNPAGYSILNHSFGEDGISPIGLLLGALPPTAVAILCFLLLPSL